MQRKILLRKQWVAMHPRGDRVRRQSALGVKRPSFVLCLSLGLHVFVERNCLYFLTSLFSFPSIIPFFSPFTFHSFFLSFVSYIPISSTHPSSLAHHRPPIPHFVLFPPPSPSFCPDFLRSCSVYLAHVIISHTVLRHPDPLDPFNPVFVTTLAQRQVFPSFASFLSLLHTAQHFIHPQQQSNAYPSSPIFPPSLHTCSSLQPTHHPHPSNLTVLSQVAFCTSADRSTKVPRTCSITS